MARCRNMRAQGTHCIRGRAPLYLPRQVFAVIAQGLSGCLHETTVSGPKHVRLVPQFAHGSTFWSSP